MSIHNHTRRNQRRSQRTKRITRVQQPLNRIRLIHRPHPRTETRIRQPVTKSAERIESHENRVRRVRRENGVSDKVEDGREDGDAALAEVGVDAGVCEGGEGVAEEGGEEDEGDDGVA